MQDSGAASDKALASVTAMRSHALERLCELVRIPSISTLSERADDVRRAAQWVAQALERLGARRVQLVETPRHPVVRGQLRAGPDRPTLLVYGHYDVQPPDPLEAWRTPPFEPSVAGDYLYARGASDMKAQLVAMLLAIEACRGGGGVPLNLEFLLEGEEEIGSTNLPGVIERHAQELKADAVLNCDGFMLGPRRPSLLCSVRGTVSFELSLRALDKDAHSGRYGGAIPNVAHELCRVVAGLHGADARVTIPAFYDDVEIPDPGERAFMAGIPYGEEDILSNSTARAIVGEAAFTPLERTTARPSLDVNGMWSGFTGEGHKSIIPASATAKLSARLVPDQDPRRVADRLRAHLEACVPSYVTWELVSHPGSHAASMKREGAFMRAALAALEQTFGTQPVFMREGGSIHVISMLQRMLGLDTILMGFALPDDAIHSPNERQHIPTFLKGIEAYTRFFYVASAIREG